MERSRIFISYSHQDRSWLERLTEQLAVLQRRGLVDIWSDELIAVGDAWEPAIETALTVLLSYHGERILRVKGICNFIGESRPMVLHGVQQLLHEPLRLENWPDDDRRTRLVFIVQGLRVSLIEETFAHFLQASNQTAAV